MAFAGVWRWPMYVRTVVYIVITKVFQKVIGKLRVSIFYYGTFTVHFRSKVHPRVPFHSPDLRKGCRIIWPKYCTEFCQRGEISHWKIKHVNFYIEICTAEIYVMQNLCVNNGMEQQKAQYEYYSSHIPSMPLPPSGHRPIDGPSCLSPTALY